MLPLVGEEWHNATEAHLRAKLTLISESFVLVFLDGVFYFMGES